MVTFDVDKSAAERLEDVAASLGGKRGTAVITRAAKRAATAGRAAGTREIRKIYTIKAGDIKKRALIRTVLAADGGGAEIRIRGPREKVETYSAKERQRGIFVKIKRGEGGLVPRSFRRAGTGTPTMREGRARLPIRPLYGPAVPQLFGNRDVLETVEERAMEVYEGRLRHEIERMVGK